MIGVSGKGSAQLGQGGIIYYVYTWLRSKATKWPIGSPYYVGKGSGLRAEDGTRMFLPPDYSFVKYFDKLGNIVDKPVYMAEQDASKIWQDRFWHWLHKKSQRRWLATSQIS